MKPEEIDKMTAGEELNFQVAIALGQTDFNHLPFQWVEGVTEDGRDGWEGNYCPRCQKTKGKCVKSYSETYQYTEELLKWLVFNGGDLFIEYWQDREWFLCNKPIPVRNGAIMSRSDKVEELELPSLPLALCRFILKVSESQKESMESQDDD